MRPDRDDFIQVNVENLAPEMRNLFAKRSYDYDNLYNLNLYDYRDATLQTPYDVLSANSVRKETVLLKTRVLKF